MSAEIWVQTQVVPRVIFSSPPRAFRSVPLEACRESKTVSVKYDGDKRGNDGHPAGNFQTVSLIFSVLALLVEVPFFEKGA